MKKAQYAEPNPHLKRERELRGWSQTDVARTLGVDHYYISRWERGLTVPSPYYRQQLCALFGKNADELGLLERDPSVSQGADSLVFSEAVISSLAGQPFRGNVVQDPAIPALLATEIVGRDRLLAEAKRSLCSGLIGIHVSLHGLPGAGKTTLAAAVVYDPDVVAQFPDGVLWAGLGPQPDMPRVFTRWGALLGMSEAQAAKLTGDLEWARALRAVIGSRRLLLVVDDAWQIEDALALQIGGPNCAYLLTTRFPPLAHQFAPAGMLLVSELDVEDGLALVRRLAPAVAAAEPADSRRLVESVGGLPLALTIAASYLGTQSYGNQPRRIQTALARLQDPKERLSLTMAAAPVALPVSLRAVIAVSDAELGELARQALRALTLFPAKPSSFSEEAAMATASCPAAVLDELSDAGLLESVEPGRYTVHQVIADYASTSSYLADGEAPHRLVTYVTAYLDAHHAADDMLEQESDNILAALRVMEAGAETNAEYAADLVRSVAAFAPFLVQRGLYRAAEAHLQRAEQAAGTLAHPTGLSAILYNLGYVCFEVGKNEVAQQKAQEGLALAQAEGNLHSTCRCLDLLAALTRYGGDYQTAHAYYQDGLALARQLEDPHEICDLLMGIGENACERGRYDEAESYLREGVTLARQTGDQPVLCGLLVSSFQVAYMRGDTVGADAYALETLQIARRLSYLKVINVTLANLGVTASDRGDYVQAEAAMLEALDLAQRLEDHDGMCINKANLGEAAFKQGHFADAERYLDEALDLARRTHRHVLLNDVLDQWGEVQLGQHKLDAAEAAYAEIKAAAEAVGSRAQEAVAGFGLARVYLERGREAQARDLAEDSLRILKSIGSRRAAPVETWYQDHFPGTIGQS